MEIAVRDTTEVDLPEIFAIRMNPSVRPHQFKLTRRDTVDLWKEHLFGEIPNGPVVFKCSTIVASGEIIGHISHLHYEVHGQKTCYCGWNLAPPYWGKGIAMLALSQLFDRLFRVQTIDIVISDCFSNNQRCIRVLHKLQFKPVGLGAYERALTMVRHRCLHWICRFQLTSEEWHTRMQESSR